MAPWKTIWHNHSLTAAKRENVLFLLPPVPSSESQGHHFSAFPDLPNVYEGSVWGAFVISAREACEGLRVSNQSCGCRRVTVRAWAMGLLLPVCRVENYSSTSEEYLVLAKRPECTPTHTSRTLHFHEQEKLSVFPLYITCWTFLFACMWRKGYFKM